MKTEETLIIVDLEATCCDKNSFPRDEMEIIEIGAVAVDAAIDSILSEFQAFVRPVRHPKLTDFCKELTTITQEDVGGADSFTDVHSELTSWLSQYGSHVFCSWGDYDRNQVDQDCRFHGVDSPFSPFSPSHRNLKREFSEAYATKKRFGVGSALKKLGLEFEGTAHRGIDDAKNIARIYFEVLSSRGK
jgi:inhibitor of KinA sporulation pathway (predicted exonuclease)